MAPGCQRSTCMTARGVSRGHECTSSEARFLVELVRVRWGQCMAKSSTNECILGQKKWIRRRYIFLYWPRCPPMWVAWYRLQMVLCRELGTTMSNRAVLEVHWVGWRCDAHAPRAGAHAVVAAMPTPRISLSSTLTMSWCFSRSTQNQGLLLQIVKTPFSTPVVDNSSFHNGSISPWHTLNMTERQHLFLSIAPGNSVIVINCSQKYEGHNVLFEWKPQCSKVHVTPNYRNVGPHSNHSSAKSYYTKQ